MKHLRLLAIATTMLCALAVAAQQSADVHHVPNAEDHLKVLSEKLSLTADQQEKVRPIMEELTDSLQKTMDDQSLSREDRQRSVHEAMMKADKEIRAYLTDEQKAKLDEMEKSMHGDHHSGTH